MESKIVILGLILGIYFVVADIPDLEDFEELKERCNKKGGNGTFAKILVARDETQTCLEGLIDIETFKNELEESKKTGSMDEVFDKYCNKRPKLRDCIKKTYDALEPCLEVTEKNAINISVNILQQVGDFACFKNGDRLALFVAEGGAECISNRSQGIQKCINETVKFNPDTFSPKSLPNLIVDKKACDDLEKIQKCTVKDLEDNCSNSTPANIIDALFRFIKNIACKDIKKRSVVYFG